MSPNRWLISGGLLSSLAALLHIAVIFGGPKWYRFFGAGEGMARLAERGSYRPALITFAIVVILALWAAYAFSGAGLIARLPFIRTTLVLITSVYLLRGLLLFPAFALKSQTVTPFIIWSSLIVLAYGVVYAIGTAQAWQPLSR